jgi:hypothetical protein
MGHLLTKHPLPHVHVNIALVIAVTWIALAVASALIDVARMVQTW